MSRKFKLSLSLDDDCAVTDFRHTIAEALAATSQRVSTGLICGSIRDLNGNRIGSFEVTK